MLQPKSSKHEPTIVCIATLLAPSKMGMIKEHTFCESNIQIISLSSPVSSYETFESAILWARLHIMELVQIKFSIEIILHGSGINSY